MKLIEKIISLLRKQEPLFVDSMCEERERARDKDVSYRLLMESIEPIAIEAEEADYF